LSDRLWHTPAAAGDGQQFDDYLDGHGTSFANTYWPAPRNYKPERWAAAAPRRR
jgi:hypothetical protein